MRYILLGAGVFLLSCSPFLESPIGDNSPVWVETTERQYLVGDRISLDDTVSGNASADYTWTSTNDDILYVNDLGIVTAYAPGKVVLEGMPKSSSGLRAQSIQQIQGLVGPRNIPAAITDLQISVNTTLSLTVGERASLNAEVLPSNQPQGVSYSSTNTDTAVIDREGVVYPQRVGNTTLTALALGDLTTSQSVSLTVSANLLSFIGHGDAQLIARRGSIVYVGFTDRRIEAYDISTPLDPQPVGTFESTTQTYRAMSLSDSLFAATYIDADTGETGVQLFSFEGDGRLKKEGTITASATVQGLFASNDSLYVAYQSEKSEKGGLVDIYTVSDPAQPSRSMRLLMPYLPTNVSVYQETLYVCTQDSGLLVFDISDLSAIQHKTTVSSTEACVSLTHTGSAGLLLLDHDSYRTVQFLDLSDPAQPVENFLLKFPDDHISGKYISHVSATDSIMVLSKKGGGLDIYDISQSSTPLYLTYVTGAELGDQQVYQSALDTRYIYLADSFKGLYTLQYAR